MYGELSHGILQSVEHKKAEKALRVSEENFRAYLESSPISVFVANQNAAYEYVNHAATQLLDYSREELLKMTVQQVIPKEDIHKHRFDQLKEKGYLAGEMSLKRKNDTPVDVFLSASRLPDGKLIAFCEDITERKKAEAALVESEANYKSLIEGMDESIWVIDFYEGFIKVNDAAVKALGYLSKELLTLGIKGIDKYLTREQLKNLINDLHAKRHQIFETVHTAKDGTQIPVEISSSLITYRGKQAILSIARNITERKKAQQTLSKSEERYRNLADSLPEIVFETDNMGKLIYANERAFEVTKYSKEDFAKGLYVFDFILQKDKERAKENFGRVSKNIPSENNEYSFVRKDGSTFSAVIISRPILVEKSSVGLRGLVIDITERKEFEKSLKENNHRIEVMNEKLRVVGNLTMHDVRNKLMGAKSNAYLLKKRLGDNPELAKYVDGIESSLAAADRLFEFSRLYERIGAEKVSNENVFECFNQAASLIPNLGTVKIVNECQGLEVVADSLLKQLFYNFMDNSLKHGEKVTKIRLSYTEGNELKLFYEDDGVGVSEANKSKLFNAGFSTGKGSGFGLYLAKKIMDVYGWTITEQGKPGEGVKFVMVIPSRNNQNGNC